MGEMNAARNIFPNADINKRQNGLGSRQNHKEMKDDELFQLSGLSQLIIPFCLEL